MLGTNFQVAASREIDTWKPIIYESFDAEIDCDAYKPPIVKCEGLNNSLKKGKYRYLCPEF